MIDEVTLSGLAAGRLKCGAGQGQEMAQELLELKKQVGKLLAFKAYVHQRLDEAGVPVNPPGKHADKGCRIGQRLDLVLSKEP
jgi:hypothetical protein